MITKVCGATSRHDLEVLATAGADMVGLWHGIPGGRADLSATELARLAAAARTARQPQPVLVTFIRDPAELADILAATRVRWVQLHGYQPPGVVRELKARGPAGLTVVKVLHLRDRECPEHGLIGAYERAGTDVFLLDAMTAGGRIGSTSHRLTSGAVSEMAGRLSLPFLLAGGICAAARAAHEATVAHPLFLGIDVDTAARDAAGHYRAGRIAQIRRAWQPASSSEGAHGRLH